MRRKPRSEPGTNGYGEADRELMGSQETLGTWTCSLQTFIHGERGLHLVRPVAGIVNGFDLRQTPNAQSTDLGDGVLDIPALGGFFDRVTFTGSNPVGDANKESIRCARFRLAFMGAKWTRVGALLHPKFSALKRLSHVSTTCNLRARRSNLRLWFCRKDPR